MLASGGTLALFWNRPSGGDNQLYDKSQTVYSKYMPKVKPRKFKPEEEVFDERKLVIEKYGFIDLELKVMHQTREFNAEDYISLLNSYSDHRSLGEDIKIPFYNAIRAAINKFGGSIIIYDTMDLYLARKP
jgi:hypothetical protein